MTNVCEIDGRRHLIRHDGTAVDIDARPPAGHTPTPPLPTGTALLPCRICRHPLAAALARRGAHLGCLPDHHAYGLLRICGTSRVWSTLIPVYRGETLRRARGRVGSAPTHRGGAAA